MHAKIFSSDHFLFVSVWRAESKNSPLQMEMISDTSVTHIELDDLDPNSHYIFQVIARTAAGEGPPITRRSATLLDGGDHSQTCFHF